MIFNINRKLLNIVTFVLLLLAGMALLYRIRLHSMSSDISVNITYLLVLFIIVLSFAQFLASIFINEHKVKEVEKTEIEEDNQKEEKKEEKKEEQVKETKSTLDTKTLLSNIIPPKSATVEEYGETLLMNMAKELQIVQGVVHTINLSESIFSSVSFYAYFSEKKPEPFKIGETLPGQVARNKELLQIDNIPDDFIQVLSGLGDSTPNYMVFVPVIKDDTVIAVIEFATFKKYDNEYIALFKELGNKVSTTFFNYVKGTESTTDGKK